MEFIVGGAAIFYTWYYLSSLSLPDQDSKETLTVQKYRQKNKIVDTHVPSQLSFDRDITLGLSVAYYKQPYGQTDMVHLHNGALPPSTYNTRH